jgi:hypothetical protein
VPDGPFTRLAGGPSLFVGQHRAIRQLGQAEIQQLGFALVGNHNVARFDVAVRDTGRMPLLNASAARMAHPSSASSFMPCREMIALRVRPRTYSITMNSAAPSEPMSYIVTMPEWLRAEAARAS